MHPGSGANRLPIDNKAVRVGLYHLSLRNTCKDIIDSLQYRGLLDTVQKFIWLKVKRIIMPAAGSGHISGVSSSPM